MSNLRHLRLLCCAGLAVTPALGQSNVDGWRARQPSTPSAQAQVFPLPKAVTGLDGRSTNRHDSPRSTAEQDPANRRIFPIRAASHQRPEADAPFLPVPPDSAAIPAGDPLPAPPAAAPAPSPIVSEGLTLAGLEALALQHNPTLRQAGALVQQAQGNWLQSGLYPNPTVGYMGSEIGNDDNAGQQGLFVSQNVVTADKLDLNRAVQSWDVERARWQAEAQRQRVLNAVRIRYYNVLGAQQTVAIAEQLLGIAQKGVEIAQQLLEAKQAPRTDLLQAQIELNTVALLLRTSQQREDAARRDLAAVVGIAELPPGPLAGELADDLPQPDFETAWQNLEAASPLLHAARTQVARAQAQLRRAQVEPVPDLQLQGSVQQDFATDYTLFGAQVGVTLPLHNRNQGNISAAVAEMRRASENVARVQLALRQQLAEVHRRLEAAHAQVEVYREEILPDAEQTLQLTTEAYRAGELDFLRVLTARRTYIQAQVNLVAALTELRIAQTEVDGLLLTGGLDDPEDLAIGTSNVGGADSMQPLDTAIAP